MTRFPALPEVPSNNPEMFHILTSMKEALEVLMGTRGRSTSRVVMTDTIKTAAVPAMNFRGLTSSGMGVTLSGQAVVSYADYIKLLEDTQALAADVAQIRNTLNTLLTQLRGTS